MKKIDVSFILNTQSVDKTISIETSEGSIIIRLNVFNLENYELVDELNKIENLIKVYNSIKRVNLIFHKSIEISQVNKILSKMHDVLYQYYNITREIKLYLVSEESANLMKELDIYKNIVMDPNKNPNTYLEYIKSRVPDTHDIVVFDVNTSGKFPLTKAVGSGSQYPSYFVHIKPKNENPNKKNIYMVGKAITFDSGGMNIKDESMLDMKIDMTGSAILTSVLNLFVKSNNAPNLNVHLVIPIAENMVGNTATRPGQVVKTTGGKTVEITDTDAEGRLCLADGFEFVQLNLTPGKDLSKCLIVDVATLTGSATTISNGISSLILSNNTGSEYSDKLIAIGEETGEYLDYLKIRPEYLKFLTSKVADIRNLPKNTKAGCIIAGCFLNYFINPAIPWIHIDLGKGTYVNEVAQSHGINLLFEFIKNIN
jgi:leucyl aminopeptidase